MRACLQAKTILRCCDSDEYWGGQLEALKLLLSLSSSARRFEEVFVKIKHDTGLELRNKNSLDIYCSNIENSRFSYNRMYELLAINIAKYVFSRTKVRDARDEDELSLLTLQALDKFREIRKNNDNGSGGELGELLLYLFLEKELGAPKILSKMELKTNQNDYIKGCDGVFLHSFDQEGYTNHQLVLGESKVKGNLREAINQALNSIAGPLGDTTFETSLVSDNLFKETFSREEAERIKRMIIPNATEDHDKKISKNKAVGIFIGYTFRLDQATMSPSQWMDAAFQKCKQDIEEISPYIIRKINEKDLSRYPFYIYLLPMNDAENDRSNIMQRLIMGRHSFYTPKTEVAT